MEKVANFKKSPRILELPMSIPPQRLRMITEDQRPNLEQISFGDVMQHYVARGPFKPGQLIDVVRYIKVEGLDTTQIDDLVALISTRFSPKGVIIAKYDDREQAIVSHYYAADHASIVDNVRRIEARLFEAIAEVRQYRA
jgi:hypothetical protein